MLVPFKKQTSSDFRRSISQTVSEDGTIPYRPKTELVPYSDVHCIKIICTYTVDVRNRDIRFSALFTPVRL